MSYQIHTGLFFNGQLFDLIIDKDPGSDFGVTIPGLPGAFSAGPSFGDALAQSVEAIEGHLEAMNIYQAETNKFKRVFELLSRF